MMEALLGDVNRPMPTPITAQQEEQPDGRRPEGPQEAQAQGDQRHPAHGERPGPDVVGEPSRQRGDDPEGQRHGHQLQAGSRRPQAEAALQVEGDQQQHPEHHEVRADTAGDPRREARVLEEPEVEHRVAVPPFVPDEQPGEDDGGDEETDDHARVPPQHRPEGDRGEERHHGREEQPEAGPVEAHPRHEVPAAGDKQDRRDGAEQPERDVDEEDEAPAARGQEQPADARAEGETQALGRALQTDGPPESPTRDDQHDDGQAVRLQHRRADRLQRPEDAQGAEVRGQAAQHRGQGEDDEAVDVEQLAAPHVGEAPDGDDGGHEDQQVRKADPGHGADRDAEGVLQGGEGDGDDGRIELAHERTDAHGRHGEPVGVAALPYGLGPARLDQESVPRPRPRTRSAPAPAPVGLPAAARHIDGGPPHVTTVLALMSRDDAPTSTS